MIGIILFDIEKANSRMRLSPILERDVGRNYAAGSFLSLSSFASYSFREENFSKDSRRDSQPLFSTVKRSPSPFGKVGQADLGRRREPRRKLDPSRPPLPPLPPVPPRSHITESLTNLRQRLDEISGFPTASYSLNQGP